LPLQSIKIFLPLILSALLVVIFNPVNSRAYGAYYIQNPEIAFKGSTKLVPIQGQVQEYRIQPAQEGETDDEANPPPIIERTFDPAQDGKEAPSPSSSPETGAEEPGKPAGTSGPTLTQTIPPTEIPLNGNGGAPKPSEAATATPSSPTQEPGPTAITPGGPGVELTLENMDEALVFPENQEINYEGSLLVWRNQKLYKKNPDGTYTLINSSLESLEDEYGQRWLTEDEQGNVVIQVSLKVWATINFEYNSAAILPDSEDILRAFGEALMTPALKDYNLIIAGHTDNIGSHEFNLKLSRARASSVARWLTEKAGIDPERMYLSAYAATIPIADNSTPEGRAKNRRVEFILLPSNDG
jgi:outer membrane protein OmpA-like peptidoglycan-associated protein